MDGTLESWKHQLEQGGTVNVAVTANHLRPVASRGDGAVVRRVGLNQLKPGDAALCSLDGQAELCKVSQAWRMSGVFCLEVKRGNGTSQSISEENLLGKVVEVQAGKATLQLLSPTASRLVDAFKRLTGRST